MKINGKAHTSVWTSAALNGKRTVHIIDQTALPFEFRTMPITSCAEAAEAIRTMRVRGAPLIGVTAAYGLALAADIDPDTQHLNVATETLLKTRPTAVNLAWALTQMMHAISALTPSARAAAAWAKADALAADDVITNRAIGAHGLTLIRTLYEQHQRPINILTHCNAGWLATVDWGTATAPIYMAHDAGIPVHVWVDETRPRNQGLLTAWEMRAHGVPHTYITDNAGGHFMQHGKVDLVILGADRVSRAGDVCNKIGTYLKALAAVDNGVPFYVAVPSSTIDWQLRDALNEIEIEERNHAEVRVLRGVSGNGAVSDFHLLDEKSAAANPAFDVTPARLVTGIITERGVAAPAQLAALFPETSS